MTHSNSCVSNVYILFKIGLTVKLGRRFLADNKDFSEENIEKQKIQKRFENIELSKCVKEIEEYIKTQEK